MPSSGRRWLWQDWTVPPVSTFAVLTSVRSVGVMGDERTYDYTLALRAVQSQDFMTAHGPPAL